MQIAKFLFSFRGRMGRGAYVLGFWLPLLIVLALTELAFPSEPSAEKPPEISIPVAIVAMVGTVFVIWSQWATAIKRLHDMGKSGWLSLLFFVPLANIILILVLTFAGSQPEPNQFGAVPAHWLEITENNQSSLTSVAPERETS